MKKVIAFAAVVLCCSMTTVMAQGGGGQQRTPEERMAAMKEQLKPLNLTAVQTDSAVAILTDRTAMGNMRDLAPEARTEAMKTWTEARNKRLEKALGAELAKKVIDAMPQRGGGRPGGGGGK
ncbi:MAG: hypothetical protein V4557_17715 [Bacteroidota bacterium]